MNNKDEALFDMYATAALQALIAKTPLMDREGEFSKKYSQEELNAIKFQLCESALGYAGMMLMKREEYISNYVLKS